MAESHRVTEADLDSAQEIQGSEKGTFFVDGASIEAFRDSLLASSSRDPTVQEREDVQQPKKGRGRPPLPAGASKQDRVREQWRRRTQRHRDKKFEELIASPTPITTSSTDTKRCLSTPSTQQEHVAMSH